MSEEQTKSQLEQVQEEREDQETLINVASEYTEVTLSRGYGKGRTDTKLRIYRPTMADRAAASRFGKAQFISCLQEGIPTRAQAVEAARKAGLWTEQKENRMTEIASKIDGLVDDQETTENKATKAKIREKIRKLKREQLDIAATFSEVTRNTIEQIQDDAEQSFLIVRTVRSLDGNGDEIPLYSDINDLNSERDIRFIEQVNNACSAFWMGDSVSDFFALGELLEEEISEQDSKSPKT